VIRRVAAFAEGSLLLGGTIANLAELFDVSEQTVHDWRKAHPAFRKAIQEGGVLRGDARASHSLGRERTVG
jgi:hypothetical protein